MRSAVCLIVLGMSLFPHAGKAANETGGGLDSVSVAPSASAVVWGAPLDGGAIRTLFIAPRAALRDVGELALRLDLDYDIAPVQNPQHLGGDEDVARLRERVAKPHDLIVIGNLDLSILPEDALDAIINAVKGGSGLVIAHCRENVPARFQEFLNGLAAAEGAEDVTRGVGESLTPEWPASLSFVKASKCDKGRVVELNYAGGRPFSHFLLPALSEPLKARPGFLDTYFSLVARAARWAAGRSPANWIAEISPGGLTGPDAAQIPPDLPPEFVQEMHDSAHAALYRSYRIRLNAPAASAYDVRVRVREPNRGLDQSYPELPRMAKGETNYQVDLPLGPGTYFLDLWLLRKKKVVEWHTEAVTVSGWPEISDVVWSKGNLLPNDALNVSFTVRADYHRPRSCVAYARATDALGRLVAEANQPVPAEGGPVRITLSFADLISNLVKAEVFVVDAQAPTAGRVRFTHWDLDRAAYSHLYLPVHATQQPTEFGFAIESRASDEYNVRALDRVLAKCGVDSAILDGRDDTLTGQRFYLAEMNLWPIPELTRYAPETADGGKMTFPCVTDDAFRKDEDKRLKENAATFWAVGASLYLLGNGNRLGDAELPACFLDGFRERLSEQYRLVDSLNRAWGTQFGAWEQVVSPSAEEAAKDGRYAPWLDYRRYLDEVFCQAHVDGCSAVRATDADARVGFRAVAGSSAKLGYDWWQLASQLDVLALEAGPVAVDMARSYRKPNAHTALCVGAEDLSESRCLPWYAALHGMQSVWWTEPFGESASAISPGGTPTPAFVETAASVSELKQGLGTLLAGASRRPPGIAIYGSQSSLYLNEIAPQSCGSRDAEAAFAKLLERLALQYDFVSYAQALQGKLNEYALVILPMARALSDEEVAAIRAFNAKGGRVIADVAPGEFDAHGVRRGAFPLDDMFGVRHRETPKLGVAGDVAIRLVAGDTEVAATLPAIAADVSVEADKAHACGAAQGAPVWCVQGSDKSFTALLNHALPACADNEEAVRLFGALLDAAGVVGGGQVTPAPGRLFRGECVSSRYGEADIVALLAEPGAHGDALKASITLGRDWWSYNAREGKALGHSKKLDVKVKPGDALVVSLLPYSVDALYLAPPGDAQAGRRVPVRVTLKTNGAMPGKHLVHVTLEHGLAGPIAYYAQNVVCTHGEAETFIPLALDEAPGIYTIVARDVLTGVSTRADFNVVNPNQPAPKAGFGPRGRRIAPVAPGSVKTKEWR